MTSKRSLFYLYLLIAFCSICLISLGGFVRASSAGLSCPDWPLCYGRVIPLSFRGGVFQEVLHRYLAAAVTILFVVAAYLTLRAGAVRSSVRSMVNVLLAILLAQIVLGGLTVLLRLNPLIVTAHLALGTVFFQVIGGLVAEFYECPERAGSRAINERSFVDRNYRRLVWITASMIFLQMLVGGLVGSSGASLACPDFPLCQPESWYGAGGAQILQMTHRLLAVLLLPLLLLNVKAGLIVYREHRALRFAVVLLPIVLYLLQALLGWLNLLLGIPVFITVPHLITAQLLLQTQVQNLRLQARW